MPETQTPQPLEVLRRNVQPEEIAIQYLQHELGKLFPDQDRDFQLKMDRQVKSFPRALGEKDFWQLVSGLSEGFKLKWVYRTLTDTSYSWSLERIALDDIQMTGMSPFMDPILRQADWRPSRFAQIWREHPEYAQVPEARGITPNPKRDQYPIILREKDKHLLVFDGMRRTCLAALENKPDLEAWVGRTTNPNGQMMINPDKVLFLRVLYDEAKDKNPQLLEAIKVVLETYIKEYRNGREVAGYYLSPWGQNPDLVKIVKEILGK